MIGDLRIYIVDSIFLGCQNVIKYNPFIVFLVSFECLNGAFYSPR